MMNLTTNFFEILISPQIDELFLTDRSNVSKLEFTDNIVANYDKTSLISLLPINSNSKKKEPKPLFIEWLLKKALFEALDKTDFSFDPDYRDGEISILKERISYGDEYSILRRISLRVFSAHDKFLVAVQPFTKTYNRLSLVKLLSVWKMNSSYFLKNNNCLVLIEKDDKRIWARGRLRDIFPNDKAKVDLAPLYDGTIEVSTSRIIPSLDKKTLTGIISQAKPNFDLVREAKRLSDTSSKVKFDLINSIVGQYLKPVFPLVYQSTEFDIATESVDPTIFPTAQIKSVQEPNYVVKRGDREVVGNDRLRAMSDFNLPVEEAKEHKVVLFGNPRALGNLRSLVERLNDGFVKSSYRMSLPEKFGIKLSIADEFTVLDYASYSNEIDRYLFSSEEKHKDAFPIFHLPLLSDLYYPLKAKFAHHGKVSQVISQNNFDIYAAWNLAENLYAKLGYTPWGISESPDMPNADIVLGLAYSSLKSEGQLQRNIGYVNVFDKSGVWRFVKSSPDYFDFEKRSKLIPQMIHNAIRGFSSGGNNPQIIDIHYTKTFSRDERKRIYESIANELAFKPQVNFISIDKSHSLWIFDKSNANMNLVRGGVLKLNEREFIISVAGENKPNALASRLLKVQVWREPFSTTPLELRPIAYRILAMSKLNWRSAVRETTEPATLKFAGQIAKLTNQFSLTEWKDVNNLLSDVPWFI